MDRGTSSGQKLLSMYNINLNIIYANTKKRMQKKYFIILISTYSNKSFKFVALKVFLEIIKIPLGLISSFPHKIK